jgi:VCBS repeat protein
MRPASSCPKLPSVLLVLVASQIVGCGGGMSPPPVPPPQASVSYVPAASFSSGGTHAGSVAVADFNGDGKIDIAVSNFSSNTVAVFLNTGTGSFGTPVLNSIVISNGLGPLVAGDFNEDGKPDLIAATISGPQVDLVLLGNGDGTFTTSASIPNSFGFLQGRVADLNGDRHLDVVGGGNGNISVALGNGDGTFQPVTYLPSGPFPNTYFGIDVGDFNGDRKLDILGANFGSDPNNLVLFAGNGDGTFELPSIVPSGSSTPDSLSAADFDGDGKLDLLVGFDGGVANVFTGNGGGGFSMSGSVYAAIPGGNGIRVLAADLNRDGKSDALVTDYVRGVLTIKLNDGTGLSKPSKTLTFTMPAGLSDVAVGDLNGDGLPDLVVANSLTDQITLFLSQK